MNSAFISSSVFALALVSGSLTFAVSANAAVRPVRIQDLVAVEEKGISKEELHRQFATAFASVGTRPDAVTAGSYPNSYISGSYPSQVTRGSAPNIVTAGSRPFSYTSGGLLQSYGQESFPSPRLAF